MIELKVLEKSYGKLRAVQALDLSVKNGELFGFLGPNGAGKTTTIKMMVGLLRAALRRRTPVPHAIQKEPSMLCWRGNTIGSRQ